MRYFATVLRLGFSRFIPLNVIQNLIHYSAKYEYKYPTETGRAPGPISETNSPVNCHLPSAVSMCSEQQNQERTESVSETQPLVLRPMLAARRLWDKTTYRYVQRAAYSAICELVSGGRTRDDDREYLDTKREANKRL
jgi:hypothetical protein